MLRLAVVGAGGCARETAWTIREATLAGDEVEFAGYVVTDLALLKPTDSATDVLGQVDDVIRRGGIDGLVAGIGSPIIRRRVIESIRASHPNVVWPTIVHPTVQYDRRTSRLGQGVVIAASTVLTVNVEVGDFVLIHYGCTVGH